MFFSNRSSPLLLHSLRLSSPLHFRAFFCNQVAKLVDEIRRNLANLPKQLPRDASQMNSSFERDTSNRQPSDKSGKVSSELPDLRPMPPSATAAGTLTTKLATGRKSDRDDAVAALDRL